MNVYIEHYSLHDRYRQKRNRTIAKIIGLVILLVLMVSAQPAIDRHFSAHSVQAMIERQAGTDTAAWHSMEYAAAVKNQRGR
jgi:hypothetical protein